MTNRSNKWRLIVGTQAVAYLLCALFACSSELPNTIRVESPDQPRVWYVGGNFWKISQSLRWDRKSQTLYLDVIYSLNGEWPKMEDSDLYHLFSVAFPMVKSDRLGNRLYFVATNGQKVPVATVTSSFFGDRTSPDKNVEISVHRRNGVLDAALVVSNP